MGTSSHILNTLKGAFIKIRERPFGRENPIFKVDDDSFSVLVNLNDHRFAPDIFPVWWPVLEMLREHGGNAVGHGGWTQ